MIGVVHTDLEASLLRAQIGRAPREPWRVAVRCGWGNPKVIVSPSTLEDGTPFPTLAWLSCPWLSERVSALESAGGSALWAARVAAEPDVARALIQADSTLRALRAAQSGGCDACASVGIAGQKDALLVKCLHAHVALALLGIEDPVGLGVLAALDRECPDERCAHVSQGAEKVSRR